jgi:DNA topoisomerase IA
MAQPGTPGRPKGSRHKYILAMEALFEREGEAIARKAIELAKNGDQAALRLCFERLSPVKRERTVSIECRR